jgi:16S rRNA (adenine1518-N6/adenine1519-N6)-dimethyltransferase
MSNEYIQIAKSIGPLKKLGQSFLINKEIARKEAIYGQGKRVLELGPGLGILTNELCKVAKSVTAIEKDTRLYMMLSGMLDCGSKLNLINMDFFSASMDVLKSNDIMVSNVPYNLSSKVIAWLSKVRMPALLCLQKEFVEHMLAPSDTRKYSKLSVLSDLEFSIYKIMDVHAGNFYPKPKVNSTIVFIKPKSRNVSDDISTIIGLLMNHKKKKLRNAIIDSKSALEITEEEASRIAGSIAYSEERVFKINPEKLEEIAKEIKSAIKVCKSNST